MTRDEDHEAMPTRLAAMLLRAARVHGRLSQRELAAKAGVSASTVARAEAGTGPPTWAIMARLVRAAGCSLRLFGGDGKAIEPWLFETVRDRGGRHPLTPTHTFEMRSRHREEGDADDW